MVKGVSRQVIVVKSPDPKLFDEAVFFLREDALSSAPAPEEIIRQARQAADSYLRRNTSLGRAAGRIPGPVWGAAGAGAASLRWAGGLFLLGMLGPGGGLREI